MDHGWIATTFGMGNAFKVFSVRRDEALSALIVERCQEFHRLLLAQRPPGEEWLTAGEAIGKALAKIFSNESGETIEIEESFAPMLESLDAARELKKGAEAEIEEITNALKLRMGVATVARVPGYPRLAKWATETRKAHEVAESTTRVLRFVKDGKGRP